VPITVNKKDFNASLYIYNSFYSKVLFKWRPFTLKKPC
jgi:hypothetical protein